MESKTCILYFSLSPHLEAQRKNWTKSKRANLKIAQRLHRHSQREILASKLPFCHIDESDQEGQSFGERLSIAIEKLFHQGYEHLIVVGNDCPTLHVSDFKETLNNRRAGLSTIGKTKDGGVFLFDVTKKDWSKEEFSALAWCTPELGGQLKSQINKNNGLELLSVKKDVDIIADLIFYMTQLSSSFGFFLKSIWCFFNHRTPIFIPVYSSERTLQKHRGPPFIS